MAAPNRRKRQKVHHFAFIITWLKINLTTKPEIDFYTGGMPHNTQKITPLSLTPFSGTNDITPAPPPPPPYHQTLSHPPAHAVLKV